MRGRQTSGCANEGSTEEGKKQVVREIGGKRNPTAQEAGGCLCQCSRE